MTNEIKLEVTCVHCLGVGEKQLYPIINRQDLEAKQNILRRFVFISLSALWTLSKDFV